MEGERGGDWREGGGGLSVLSSSLFVSFQSQEAGPSHGNAHAESHTRQRRGLQSIADWGTLSKEAKAARSEKESESARRGIFLCPTRSSGIKD